MLSKYILSVCFLIILSTQLPAQNTNKETGLTPLKSHSQFFYSKGYETRAETLKEFLSEAKAFYQSEYPEIFSGINVLILDKNDWVEKYLIIPYGIPFFDNEKSIVIPADKFTAAMELGYEDLSTDKEISEYDKYVLNTLGQSYILKSRNIKVPEVWMQDFLSTYFAISFFEVNDFVWALNPGEGEDIIQRSLSAYNLTHKDLPAANYYWYQARFIELSTKLFNKGGFQLLTELLNHFQGNGSIERAEEIISKYAEAEYQEWKAKMK
ncbi:MAG: hypothetical protein IPI60_08010 [Saprospiraceae bacterium]|nr:hypothetical protein [Saprospiraceae bacterium]